MTNVEILMSDCEFGSVSMTDDELTAECKRLTDIYTEIEGDDYSVTVRPPRSNEAAGTYVRTASGDLQILGYSLDMDDACHGLSDISSRAWEMYCKG